MLIKEDQLQYWIDYFFGYGSWEAKTWFVGYEEPGGDFVDEVSEKLNFFYNAYPGAHVPTLCDIRELYKSARYSLDGPRAEKFATMFDYRFGDRAIINGVWKNLVAFGCGFRGEELPEMLPYQRNHFASPGAKEVMIQLLPLPSPHAHAWYYSWLDLPRASFLRTREQYQTKVFPGRIENILRNITAYKPEVVLMYGMENVNKVKQSIKEFFPSTQFKMVKGMKLRFPQHHRAEIGTTSLIITTQMPALKHNRIETGFDWYEFGRLVSTDR
jgi:hypothetical protein